MAATTTTTAIEIRFSCEHCRKEQRAPKSAAGRQGTCSGCKARIRVPAPALEGRRARALRAHAEALAAEPVVFASTSGPEDDRTTCLLVIERDSLRVLECRHAGTVVDGPAADPRALLVRLAKLAHRDERVAFDRIHHGERRVLGGLEFELVTAETLHVPLGDEVAELALKQLGATKGFAAGARELSLLEASCLPGLFAVGVGGLGWLLCSIASAFQTGLVVGGRLGLVGELMGGIGPTPFAAVAGLLVALALLRIAANAVSRPSVPVLCRA